MCKNEECFQVPPAELVVPHQTFEKLLPLINLHERSLFGIILVPLFILCSSLLGQCVALVAMCFWYFLYHFLKETMDLENLCIMLYVCIVIVLPDQLFRPLF